MKKKLEADLISIAHRILQMKNKSDQDQVFTEVQKLYEKLTVMRFVEEHFSEIKPTAGSADVEAEMEKAFEDAEAHEAKEVAEKEGTKEVAETKVAPEKEGVPEKEEAKEVAKPEEEAPEKKEATEVTEAKEEAAEEEETKEAPEAKQEAPKEEEKAADEKEVAVADEEKEEAPEEKAAEPEAKEEKPEAVAETEKEAAPEPEEDKKEERKPTQISFDDLMQHHYEEPVFERADAKKEASIPEPETPPQPEAVEEAAVALGGDEDIKVEEMPKAAPQEERRPSSLHEQIGKTITIGLNDRIGFEKNLFAGSAEDMNRVLSQLNTFNSLQEAKDFIEDMVKPDYNNWTGKEDYEQRFLDIVERKFS